MEFLLGLAVIWAIAFTSFALIVKRNLDRSYADRDELYRKYTSATNDLRLMTQTKNGLLDEIARLKAPKGNPLKPQGKRRRGKPRA